MRYLDFTRPKKTKTDSTTKYARYIQSYQFYENTPQRKNYMKDYNKAYRDKNADYIECDCGAIIKSISMYNHVKSKQHIKYITS